MLKRVPARIEVKMEERSKKELWINQKSGTHTREKQWWNNERERVRRKKERETRLLEGRPATWDGLLYQACWRSKTTCALL